MIPSGALLQRTIYTSPDITELHHLGHGRMKLVVAACGYLPGMAGLEIAVPPLRLAQLVGFKAAPSSLAVEGDS